MKDAHLTQRDIDKIVAGIIYIIEGLGNGHSVDHHSIFKTMYLADKKKLGKHGVAIFNDWYRKMEYGPVPSISRNALMNEKRKGTKYSEHITYMGKGLENIFENGQVLDAKGIIPVVSAKVNVDHRHFSKKDLEFLDQAISEILEIGIGPDKFMDRSHVSHDQAYNSVPMNEVIPEREIVKTAGNEGVLAYFDERKQFTSMFR